MALDVAEEVVQHLERAVAAVRERHPELRWVASRRWHVTLAFLGEVDDGRMEPLSARLARVAARYEPMSLCFGGSGRFGSRVLWTGLRGDIVQLGHLAASVASASRKAGVPVDERPHQAHVTIARGRTTSSDLRPPASALADYEGPTWQAETFSLVRSHLGPDPSYDTLRSWPLGG